MERAKDHKLQSSHTLYNVLFLGDSPRSSNLKAVSLLLMSYWVHMKTRMLTENELFYLFLFLDYTLGII